MKFLYSIILIAISFLVVLSLKVTKFKAFHCDSSNKSITRYDCTLNNDDTNPTLSMKVDFNRKINNLSVESLISTFLRCYLNCFLNVGAIWNELSFFIELGISSINQKWQNFVVRVLQRDKDESSDKMVLKSHQTVGFQRSVASMSIPCKLTFETSFSFEMLTKCYWLRGVSKSSTFQLDWPAKGFQLATIGTQ